ncbi:MAG: tetratricopeptide repeat protein [Nostocaceae cyanobacterium]|nr:tetratricopeptide repeat protein [Nostocaceae cyanobacterium]
MSQPRNRWIINVVLLLAVLAFIGVSMIPLIGAINDSQSSRGNTATAPGQAATALEKSKLEDQARGYELVLQREPENQTALKGLLEARLQLLSQGQGKIQDVIQPLEKLAALNPQNTEYTILLAQAKQQTGDREGAAVAYRSILETKPGDIKALQGMVALLLEQKRPEAAIGLLQDTLSTAAQANKIQAGSVDTTAVQVLLGNVHASQKRYSEALTAYDQAIKADKQDFRPVLAKAIVLKEQGKTDEAKTLFDSAASLAPPQYKDQISQLATAQPTPSSNPGTGASSTPAATPAPTPAATTTP